ncbi:hypothetical protein [Streptomyces sp. Ag109_O5-1]|uniref:hypothetical protein n=1 Tax=Streptomyces sp. Ag109_O5-1 TaxID=1938851 RepID=UPI000F5012A2|nr:hypothetical protein [Streptomyces sp. Ag109_O5-1]
MLAGGLAVLLHGILRSDIAHALGGGCLTITAVLLLGIVAIRRWILNTSDERRALAAAERAAVAERSRYFAGQAAQVNERSRLSQDVAAARARLTERLKVERVALEAEFEEKRAALIAETMEATVLMIRDRKLAPDTPAGNLIPFPQPQPGQRRERSREHGSVHP